MAKKKYSAASRERYHKSRVNSNNVSKNKKLYSREWLDGFTDPHAAQNYQCVCSEIKSKKGHVSRDYSIILHGYRNGLKAQLDEKNK